MRIKKLLSLIAILSIFTVIGSPMLVNAFSGIPGVPVVSAAGHVAATGSPELPSTSVSTSIVRIGNWSFYFLILIAVIFIVVSAFQFLTAGGNPDNVTRARNTLMYALVGVALAVLAKGLVYLVKFIVGGT